MFFWGKKKTRIIKNKCTKNTVKSINMNSYVVLCYQMFYNYFKFSNWNTERVNIQCRTLCFVWRMNQMSVIPGEAHQWVDSWQSQYSAGLAHTVWHFHTDSDGLQGVIQPGPAGAETSSPSPRTRKANIKLCTKRLFVTISKMYSAFLSFR